MKGDQLEPKTLLGENEKHEGIGRMGRTVKGKRQQEGWAESSGRQT